MKRPRQEDLFGAIAPPANGVLHIDAGGAQLTPLQREFNRLSTQIDKLRAELRDWDQFEQDVQTRLAAELPRIEAATEAAQRELLATMEHLLGQPQKPALGKRDRRVLTEQLLVLVRLLIEHCPDEPELVATHDLYSARSWAQLCQQREQDQQTDLEIAQSLAAEAFGQDAVEDHGAASIEELFATVEARMNEQLDQARQQREQSRSERQQSRRAEQAAQARAEKEQEIRQSVRIAYRQLASALHPDRETDPQQRERKTALMQRINQAYAANDLLTLLSLQMEVEQIDDDALASLPQQRLAHYITVLKEQASTLRSEIQARVQELRARSGAPHLRSRKEFQRNFDEYLEQGHQVSQHLGETNRALANPVLRKMVIDQFDAEARAEARQQREERQAAEAELEFLVAFAQAQRQHGSAKPTRRRR